MTGKTTTRKRSTRPAFRRERHSVMNPSAKAAGLSFQLSSPIENRDGSIFEQRSNLRPHDNGPETSGTRVCSYSECEILYPAALSPPEPREYSVLKVHSRSLSSEAAESAFFPMQNIPEDGGFPMGYLVCGSDSSSPRLAVHVEGHLPCEDLIALLELRVD